MKDPRSWPADTCRPWAGGSRSQRRGCSDGARYRLLAHTFDVVANAKATELVASVNNVKVGRVRCQVAVGH